MTTLYPLCFEPIYRDAIWGGNRIAETFNRPNVPIRAAESWEISDRMDAQSCVAEGWLQGTTIRELIVRFGQQLLGTNRIGSKFPLLIKIIDAEQDLSVQVHPDEKTALLTCGEPKSEMWYVLEGGPVYAGFKKPVDSKKGVEALQANQLIDLLQQFQTKPGDALFIPGGCVHAIGAGCMMLEIQQNSDTTYRICDWNRKTSDDKPRELHLEQASKCIQWKPLNPIALTQLIEANENIKRWKILSTAFFSIEKWEIFNRFRVNADLKTFQILFYLDGSQKGKTILLPASSESLDLFGPLTLLKICSNF